MKRLSYTIVGCLVGLIIGLGLASCVVLASADEPTPGPEIGHRQILGATCFYSLNTGGAITALSCVKD